MKRTRSILLLTFILLSLVEIVHISSVLDESAAGDTAVFVYPKINEGNVGENFSIEIKVSNVTDLYGWEFRLKWNSTLLECVEVNEGPFLKSGGSTFFTYKINNTEGSIVVDCTLLGNVQGVSGSGTMATVKFYIETAGECPLDLYDTMLINSIEQSIVHSAVDGYFYASIRDVAVVNLVASSSYINVTVKNQGTETETFNVSTYYTRLIDPLVGIQTVTLEPGVNATLIFAWTPPTYGRYEILAEASAVPGENDLEDNTLTIIIYVSSGSYNTGGSSSSAGIFKEFMRTLR